MQEYLGSEASQKGRQEEIAVNPSACNYHSFAFDYVYGPKSQ